MAIQAKVPSGAALPAAEHPVDVGSDVAVREGQHQFAFHSVTEVAEPLALCFAGRRQQKHVTHSTGDGSPLAMLSPWPFGLEYYRPAAGRGGSSRPGACATARPAESASASHGASTVIDSTTRADVQAVINPSGARSVLRLFREFCDHCG